MKNKSTYKQNEAGIIPVDWNVYEIQNVAG